MGTALGILAADTPAEHQRLGQKVKGFNDALWYGMRQMIVARGLYTKFSQNEELKKQLLDTDDAFLVECAYKDLNWAYIFTCLAVGDDWGNVTVYSDGGKGKQILWNVVSAPEEGQDPATIFITLNEGDQLKSGVPFSLTIMSGAIFQ